MIKTILIMTLLISSNVFATECILDIPEKILVIDNIKSSSAFSKSKGSCDETEVKKVSKIVLQQIGRVNLSYISRIHSKSIRFNRTTVHVLHLFEMIKTRGLVSNSDIYRLSKMNKVPSYIGLQKEDYVNLECQFCNKLGNSTLRLRVENSVSGDKKSFLLSGSRLTPVESYVAKRDIPAGLNALEENDFRIQTTFTDKPTQLFSTREKLSFYRLTRPLKTGEIVARNAAMKSTLVRYNQPSEATYEVNGVRLKANVIPLSNGKIGDIVKFKLINGGNVSAAKVVGRNRLRVGI